MGGWIPSQDLLWSELNPQANINNRVVCRANLAQQDVSKLQAKTLSSSSQGKSHEANNYVSSGLPCLLPAQSQAEPGQAQARGCTEDQHLCSARDEAAAPLWKMKTKRKNVADLHEKLVLNHCLCHTYCLLSRTASCSGSGTQLGGEYFLCHWPLVLRWCFAPIRHKLLPEA